MSLTSFLYHFLILSFGFELTCGLDMFRRCKSFVFSGTDTEFDLFVVLRVLFTSAQLHMSVIDFLSVQYFHHKAESSGEFACGQVG